MPLIPKIINDSIDYRPELIDRLVNFGFKIDCLQGSEVINRCDSRASGALKKLAGWYIYYLTVDGVICRYGDWVKGETLSFDKFSGSSIELKNYKSEIEKKELSNKLEIEFLAEKNAKEIYENSQVMSTHQYLNNKKINWGHDYLVCDNKLIIPIIDANNNLKSLQYIFEDGSKRYLKGGRLKDCYSLVGLSYDDLAKISEIGICEGYATCLTVNHFSRMPIVMSHSCSKTKEIVNILLKYSNIKKIIIFADNDHKTAGNPGLTAAFDAQKISPEMISILYPKNIEGTDFNDLYSEKGAKELKLQLGVDAPLKILKKISNIPIKMTDFLVDGILEKNSVACIFGAPGQGKTHVALSIAIACASKNKWYKRDTHSAGPVLYICGEDINGVIRRAYAIAFQEGIKNISDLDLYITETGIPFLNENAARNVMAEIEQLSALPSLIIIDTLNRNLGDGDENSTKDMTIFYDAIDSMRQKTKATIILVHHSSKGDPTKMRGSSVIKGAINTEILVNASEENAHEFGTTYKKIINVCCTKQKSAVEFESLHFGIATNLYGPYLELLRDIVPFEFNLSAPNSPEKSPNYKKLLETVDTHAQIKGEIITLDNLNQYCTIQNINKNEADTYIDILLRRNVISITNELEIFKINIDN